jgi:hypothetical protein
MAASCLGAQAMYIFQVVVHRLGTVQVVAVAASGVVCGISIWLTFFPPAAYRRFLMRSAVPAS